MTESVTAVADYLTIPKWLNRTFLEKSLRKYFSSPTISIVTLHIEPAIAKGENFASAMYRIKTTCAGIKEKVQPFNFIVKVPYESGFGLDLLAQMHVYDKELEMYEQILPRLTTMLRKHDIVEDIFARTINVSYSKKAIVFEDLSLKGYRMPDRSGGLDETHAKMLLRKLAIYHAACAQLGQTDRSAYRNFQFGMINRVNSTFTHFYLTSFDAMTELTTQWDEFDELTEKLRKLRPRAMEKGRLAFDAKPNQFNTLIHGDMWLNNSMFNYTADGRPDNMVLVDFQFCCWTSPTIDLHYFFNTSLQEPLRRHRLELLVQYYHGELVRALKQLDYAGTVPTLLEFHGEFLANSFYAFVSSLLVQPLMINECSDDADIETLHGHDERAQRFKKMIYTNPKVIAAVKELLPVYDRLGLLD